jgi:hypothetical protein
MIQASFADKNGDIHSVVGTQQSVLLGSFGAEFMCISTSCCCFDEEPAFFIAFPSFFFLRPLLLQLPSFCFFEFLPHARSWIGCCET